MNLPKADKSNKQALLVFLKFNLFIEQNITINFTITGWQKRSPKNSKKQKQKETHTNKQTSKKSELRKFNRLKTTGRTNRKIIIVRVC